jgi:cytochrome c oxidase assembly protein subunit 15
MSTETPQVTESQSPNSYSRSPHWVALFAAVFTWPLICVGGSVTTYRVGMAVPDWPTTFGINMFLYNFWHAPFGVRVEHTHRLYGSAVGLATIVLTVWLLVADRRRWMKELGALALVGVIVQGVLGGTRVTQNSTVLAAIHGVMGQAFFALIVALCVFTGAEWINSGKRRPDPGRFRRRAIATLAMVAAQIVAGAWLRHFPSTTALVVHAVLAVAVLAHAALLASRVERHRTEAPELVPSARALAVIVTIQVVLGIAAWWMLRPFDGIPRTVSILQAMVRTGHQANGALLLAAVVVLALRATRHFEPASRSANAGAANVKWETAS